MFVVNDDGSIYLTRGDIASIEVNAKLPSGDFYKFKAGDVVRFKVFKKRDCHCVELQKDFVIEEESESAKIYLNSRETKIGDLISKPVNYWYEVELNPETNPQTIIGYDENGEKIFRLFPEGGDMQ
jgi:hypothetical protein